MDTRSTVRALVLSAAFITAAVPAAAQQLPAVPAPVAVTLNPATTAVLVLDVAESPCGTIPKCVAFVPRVVALLAAARKAGAFVAYSSNDPHGLVAPMSQPPILSAVAPAAGDPVFVGTAQDRFFNTPLDAVMRKHGITTLVLAGWKENGSLLYTAVGATIRSYTVVVADDATSGPQDYEVAIGRYQLLTQLNGNPKNEPLAKSAVTLSRTDLISFR
jgi:nicotinamidase-related amidase